MRSLGPEELRALRLTRESVLYSIDMEIEYLQDLRKIVTQDLSKLGKAQFGVLSLTTLAKALQHESLKPYAPVAGVIRLIEQEAERREKEGEPK